MQIVMSGSLAGAEMMTLRAPGRAQDVPADAAKPVDTDTYAHETPSRCDEKGCWSLPGACRPAASGGRAEGAEMGTSPQPRRAARKSRGVRGWPAISGSDR